jgi:hypothetical protein
MKLMKFEWKIMKRILMKMRMMKMMKELDDDRDDEEAEFELDVDEEDNVEEVLEVVVDLELVATITPAAATIRIITTITAKTDLPMAPFEEVAPCIIRSAS